MVAAASESERGDGLAFELPGGPDAVLLLHGFTGSPFEMRHVAGRLHAAGMRCVGPVMAGHGDGPEELGRTPRGEWVERARAELFRLDGARRTFVVGCSMGALVACALAHAHPDRVDALALLAPALRLRAAGQLAGFLGRHGATRRLLPVVAKAGGSDVCDPVMRARNPCMDAVPLAGVAELQALAREVDRKLPGIAAPALVVVGGRDHTVARSGARRLARRIGSGPARVVVLRESCHLVGIDVERDRCADEVLAFFQATSVPRAAPGTAEGGDRWSRM